MLRGEYLRGVVEKGSGGGLEGNRWRGHWWKGLEGGTGPLARRSCRQTGWCQTGGSPPAPGQRPAWLAAGGSLRAHGPETYVKMHCAQRDERREQNTPTSPILSGELATANSRSTKGDHENIKRTEGVKEGLAARPSRHCGGSTVTIECWDLPSSDLVDWQEWA